MEKLRHYLSTRFVAIFGKKSKDFFSWFINYGALWRRSKISVYRKDEFFDYKHVIEENTSFYLSPFHEMRLYGFENSIENYCGIHRRMFAVNEHGLNIGCKETNQKVNTDAPLVFTLGEYRTSILTKSGDYMVCNIGPYIHYAKGFLSGTERELIKKKFGKTLVVFPSHSIESTEWERANGFESYIDEYVSEHKIDTVIVSMFFIDIQKEYQRPFEKKGYLIFCAGHRNNADFLDRQKSLLMIADYAISESVGTHIGYCLEMNVPVQIYKNRNRLITEISEEEIDYNLIETIATPFYDYSEVITESQKKVGQFYFGLDSTKSQEALCEIVQFSNRVYLRAVLSNKSYGECIQSELAKRRYSKEIYDLACTNASFEIGEETKKSEHRC